MKRWGLSQEGLKLIACMTMLADHVGAILLPQCILLRIIGRIAFPIYCFLLAEGMYYTKNPRKYGLRLGIGAFLSELPFDLALFGSLTLCYQSIMPTILLGFLMAVCMKQTVRRELKLLWMIPFALAAEWLRTDYGGMGVVLIALFLLTRELPGKHRIQAIGMAAIFWLMESYRITVGMFQLPIELFALLSLIPIRFYSGSKATDSKALQQAFYLFYPIHLTVLYFISILK